MLWFFERGGRQARLEVLYLDAYKYEVRFVDAKGVEQIEHFRTAEDVAERQIQIQESLAAQGWHHTGSWKL
jgi:hypothetical protein